jgi:hypothetical protein
MPRRAAKEWLAEREGELLPVPYFHVVFSLSGTEQRFDCDLPDKIRARRIIALDPPSKTNLTANQRGAEPGDSFSAQMMAVIFDQAP